MNALQWFEVISSYAIQVVLLILVAALVDRWTVSSSIKSKIWNACFLSLLGIALFGILLPRLQLFHPWSALQPQALLVVAEFESVLGATLLVVWLAGSGVMLIRWLGQFLLMCRFTRSCPPITGDRAESLVAGIPAEELEIGDRRVEFRVCPEEYGPFCYQFHRPYVFLPSTLLQANPQIITHVLHHELAHLRTQHPLQLFCQKLTQCIFWFHPFVWISSRRAGLVREFVCDDASLRHASSTAAYLKALVSVAEGGLERQEGTLAIGAAKSELVIRIRRLVGGSPASSQGTGYVAVGIVLLSALVCSQIWLPTNPLASDRSRWSPWPTWSARALHALNVSVRDYEIFKHGNQLHEWMQASTEPLSSSERP